MRPEEGNARKELTGPEITALHKNLQNDLTGFTEEVNEKWSTDFSDVGQSQSKSERCAVHLEGPVAELALEAIMAPGIDVKRKSPKTMMGRGTREQGVSSQHLHKCNVV